MANRKTLRHDVFNQWFVVATSWAVLGHILEAERLHRYTCIGLRHRTSGVLRYHWMVIWLLLGGGVRTEDYSRLLIWNCGNDHGSLRRKKLCQMINQYVWLVQVGCLYKVYTIWYRTLLPDNPVFWKAIHYKNKDSRYLCSTSAMNDFGNDSDRHESVLHKFIFTRKYLKGLRSISAPPRMRAKDHRGI